MRGAWIECIPNISLGPQEPEAVLQLETLLRSSPGCTLLHVDANVDAHRTVFSFLAEQETLLPIAKKFIATALELVDMRTHHGVHPRMGAVDVFPLVPLRSASMNECIVLSRALAAEVAQQHRLPVYLYARSAQRPERVSLAHVRGRGYESLPQRLRDAHWAPDFGPAEFSPKSGAIAIGAREALIAYNISLETSDAEVASRIAEKLRGSGYKDAIGKHFHGLFRGLQAIGWFMPTYGCAQVSTNILNSSSAPLHKVFEACHDLAQQHGTRVIGSEIVGLVSETTLLDAGKYFSQKSGVALTQMEDNELISLAIRELGLSLHGEFDRNHKILERVLPAGLV